MPMIHPFPNFFGESWMDVPLMVKKYDRYDSGSYSPSHIAQITDILDFLHEYCKEKPETFTEF